MQRRTLLTATGAAVLAPALSWAQAGAGGAPRPGPLPMIKFVCLIPRRKDMTRQQFFDRWLGGHATLMRRHAEVLGVRRYVQSHRLDTPAMKAFMALRGWPDPDYDGLTEVWLDSLEAFDKSQTSPAGAAAVRELAVDEAAFADQSRVLVFMSEEYEIVPFTPARLG